MLRRSLTLAVILAAGWAGVAQAAGGSLTHLETYTGITELIFPEEAVVSPDGRHVYVMASDAVIQFGRNPDDGRLTHQKLYDDVGPEGIPGVYSGTAMALTPDGLNLYVTGQFGATITGFTRDPGSGNLTVIPTPARGGSAITFKHARELQVTTGGRRMYVLDSDAPESSSLHVIDRDPSTGQLAFVAKISLGARVGFKWATGLAVAPGDRHIYVAGYSGNKGSVALFQVGQGRSSTAPELVDETAIGSLATSLDVSPDGKRVYLADYSEGVVQTMQRAESDGALTFLERDSVGAVAEGSDAYVGPYAIGVPDDGRNVYVTSAEDAFPSPFGAVSTFTVNSSAPSRSSVLVRTDLDVAGSTPGLNGARDVAISPDGRNVYISSDASHSLVAFTRDATARTRKCGGAIVTLEGTDGDDDLRGTPEADVVLALGGSDRIRGGGGNDRICGGDGNDRLTGQGGSDRLLGGSGVDRLSGGGGKDTCDGGAGKDQGSRCERGPDGD